MANGGINGNVYKILINQGLGVLISLVFVGMITDLIPSPLDEASKEHQVAAVDHQEIFSQEEKILIHEESVAGLLGSLVKLNTAICYSLAKNDTQSARCAN